MNYLKQQYLLDLIMPLACCVSLQLGCSYELCQAMQQKITILAIAIFTISVLLGTLALSQPRLQLLS
jgi:hypothetical protein